MLLSRLDLDDAAPAAPVTPLRGLPLPLDLDLTSEQGVALDCRLRLYRRAGPQITVPLGKRGYADPDPLADHETRFGLRGLLDTLLDGDAAFLTQHQRIGASVPALHAVVDDKPVVLAKLLKDLSLHLGLPALWIAAVPRTWNRMIVHDGRYFVRAHQVAHLARG